jgi:hypothetical protein
MVRPALEHRRRNDRPLRSGAAVRCREPSAEPREIKWPRSALQTSLDLFENLLTPATRVTHHARRLAAVGALGEQHVEHRDRAPQCVAQRAPVGFAQLLVFGDRPIAVAASMALAWWRMTALASPSLGMRTISSMPASALFRAEGILVVRNAQGDSRWQALACGLDDPDHCDHVVAE